VRGGENKTAENSHSITKESPFSLHFYARVVEERRERKNLVFDGTLSCSMKKVGVGDGR